MSDYNNSSRSQSQQSKSKFYSQSAFLRTSAVYGSGEPTPFNETNTERFRRSHNLTSDNQTYRRAAGQATPLGSVTRQRSGTPTAQSTPRLHLASGGNMSGVRGSLLQGSPSAHGGYYETSNGQYGGSANTTPVRSRVGGDSPARSRPSPSRLAALEQQQGGTPSQLQRNGSGLIQRGPSQHQQQPAGGGGGGVARSAGTPVSRNILSDSNGSFTRRASGLSSGGVSSVAATPTQGNTMWSQESIVSSGTDAPRAAGRTYSPSSQQSQRRDVPLEATKKNTTQRNDAADQRTFGGSETHDLILGRGTSPLASRTNSGGSQTPTRMSRRMVPPPDRKEPEGLWVRSKGRNDAVILGSRGRCADPPSSKEAPAIPAARRILSRPDSMTGPCTVVAEESPRPSSTRVASPRGGSPYQGVVPPFKVDPSLMTTRFDGTTAGGEKETFMEPFGTEYTHRRHFDPTDTVREDIKHLNNAPTQQSPTSTGVSRSAPSRQDVNILSLHKYSPAELNEKPPNNRYMAGPPAFVFDPPRPSMRPSTPRRSGGGLSSIEFGSSAAAFTPNSTGSCTPRRRGSGVYTPPRSERPF